MVMRLKEKLSIKRGMSYQAGKEVWERVEMENALNFTELHIVPVPFHLAEKNNLLKVCTASSACSGSTTRT